METEQLDVTAAAVEPNAPKARVSIADLLRSRYPSKTHALLFEVRNAAGFSASRSCDAMAISTWPSRGLKLMGFEIKASRSDWKNELANPEKADSFARYCDEWYIVADGKGVVEPDEVPATWGWLQRVGNRLVCEKVAPGLTPEPLPRTMLAAMLKRAIDAATVPGKQEYDRGYVAGRESMKDRIKEAREFDSRALEELRHSVKAFEDASGVRINNWGGQKIGEAVRLVLDGGHRRVIYQIDHMLSSARTVVVSLESLKAAADEPVSAVAIPGVQK
jgi:hypothetical protein